MDAIRLIEAGDRCDALQEEGRVKHGRPFAERVEHGAEGLS